MTPWYQIFPLAAKFLHCRFVRCTCWKSFSAFYATAETRILSAINLSSQISKCTKCWVNFPWSAYANSGIDPWLLREGFQKTKWKFKTAFAKRGVGGSRVPLRYFEEKKLFSFIFSFSSFLVMYLNNWRHKLLLLLPPSSFPLSYFPPCSLFLLFPPPSLPKDYG